MEYISQQALCTDPKGCDHKWSPEDGHYSVNTENDHVCSSELDVCDHCGMMRYTVAGMYHDGKMVIDGSDIEDQVWDGSIDPTYQVDTVTYHAADDPADLAGAGWMDCCILAYTIKKDGTIEKNPQGIPITC